MSSYYYGLVLGTIIGFALIELAVTLWIQVRRYKRDKEAIKEAFYRSMLNQHRDEPNQDTGQEHSDHL